MTQIIRSSRAPRHFVSHTQTRRAQAKADEYQFSNSPNTSICVLYRSQLMYISLE